MKDNKMPIKKYIIIGYVEIIILFSIGDIIESQELTFKNVIYAFINSNLILLPFIILGIITYFAIKHGKKKAIKESLSEIDFNKNKGYYRDILKKYTPVELSYIDNFEINLTKSIIVTLLNLELKNKIEIKNNVINIINKDNNNLLETEIYILDSIKDGQVIIYNPYEMEGCAKKEALDHKLITKNTDKEKEVKPLFNWIEIFGTIFWIFIMLVCIFNNHVVNFLNNKVMHNIEKIIPIINISIGLIIFIINVVIFRFISKSYYLDSKSKSYKRTLLGEELNIKIEGLKNYLTNFSLLNEKEKEELTLWEEYLIYSVIFNLNNKIVKELTPLIKIEK